MNWKIPMLSYLRLLGLKDGAKQCRQNWHGTEYDKGHGMAWHGIGVQEIRGSGDAGEHILQQSGLI